MWGDWMADSVKFEDYSMKVMDAIGDKAISWLHEASGELKSDVQRNTRVDTGQLKNSWTYDIDESKQESTIGSPLENALWEEFGTGEYALNGDGRKTPWVYVDRFGEGHTTTGKQPQRTLHNAFTSLKSKLIKAFENMMKGL